MLVSLGHVGPVQHTIAALREQDQVGGNEIAVKGGTAVRQGKQGFQQPLSRFLGDRRPRDVLGQLVFLPIQLLGFQSEDVPLYVGEQIEIPFLISRIFLQQAIQGRSFGILPTDRPLAVQLQYVHDLGHGKTGFLDARLVQCLIEDVRRGVGGVEDLQDRVPVSVYDLVRSNGDDSVGVDTHMHILRPILLRPVRASQPPVRR